MISTGNDIVALKAINVARTKQQKFYNKIITGSEKALYEGQFSERLPFEYFVWLAWSVKESVFKYLQRNAVHQEIGAHFFFFLKTIRLIGDGNAAFATLDRQNGMIQQDAASQPFGKGIGKFLVSPFQVKRIAFREGYAPETHGG